MFGSTMFLILISPPSPFSTFSPKNEKYKKTSIKGGKKCKTHPNTASNNGKNITKKPFSESWEGLKIVKLVQILHGTQAKIAQKSQF